MSDARQRFDEKWIPAPNGCWKWIGSTMPNGYGRMQFRGVVRYAHRVSYELFKCDIPDGMMVCHTCDVRNCVNPEHLFVGTAQDNVRDAWRKGRLPLPPAQKVRPKIRKLNCEQRKEIRYSPLSGSELARRFNVSRSLVSMIRSGKRAAS
jgi:hypothetical protein